MLVIGRELFRRADMQRLPASALLAVHSIGGGLIDHATVAVTVAVIVVFAVVLIHVTERVFSGAARADSRRVGVVPYHAEFAARQCRDVDKAHCAEADPIIDNLVGGAHVHVDAARDQLLDIGVRKRGVDVAHRHNKRQRVDYRARRVVTALRVQ